MEIKQETSSDSVTISPIGRIDSNNSSALEEKVMSFIGSGATNVVMNFSQVDYISSAGLRVMLMAAKKMKSSGGEFSICEMNNNVKSVFKMSGFDRIITIN